MRFLLILLLQLFSISAYSSIYFVAETYPDPVKVYGTSFESTCSSFGSEFGAYASQTYTSVISSYHPAGQAATCMLTNQNNASFSVNVARINGSCPPTYEDDGSGNCHIPPKDCTDDEGQESASNYYKQTDIYSGGSTITPNFFCSNECLQQMNCSTDTTTVVTDGVDEEYSYCSTEQTAFNCTESDNELPNYTVAPPESTCQNGQRHGTVNGQTVCLKENGEVVDTTKPKVTESETQTDKTKTDNGDGTSTETTTSTKTDGNGNTTTTTTTTIIDNTSGEVQSETVQETKEEKESEEGSVTGGGSCDAPPVCDGDAIQCAILKQSFDTKCALTPPDPSEITAESLGVGEDDTVESLSDEDSIFDISELLDTTGFLGGSCPAPRTINVTGLNTSFVLDLEPFCTLAEYVGIFVLVVASFISIRIIGR